MITITWRKSSYSNSESNCVEVGTTARAVAVRDSKNPAGPVLAIPAPRWQDFTRHLRDGRAGR